MIRSFDLILVFASFRRSTIFLPIVKMLSAQFKIGILPLQLPLKEKRKTRETDSLFLGLCVELGAEILKGARYHAKISIIPQWPYSEEQLIFLETRLQSDRVFWMVGLTMGNFHFDRLGKIKVDKLLVPDLDLYHYRLKVREEEQTAEITPSMLVEIGVPFKKYPVLPDMGIDYLWANPTPLSLPDVINRLEYLECVKRLIDNIPEKDVIALKPHNAIESHDYIVSLLALYLLKFPLIKPFSSAISRFSKKIARKLSNGPLKNAFLNLVIAHTYMEILRRVTPLKALTSYHNFSLELILPQVKKGLITGRSNSIWHGLYTKLPVYNCVDKNQIIENKTKMNYESMKYFEVPYCNGRLEFEAKHFDVIREETRKRDLIKWLSNELTICSSE
ncbi:MAG: hypothetical protein JRJ35_05250 [Deltaproteobacteria bacterium]|nr:hypothetical protein [Deltaproteobacteria bacterium]MBW1922861.1 hypothetical protein [Deltaproteobacteria bacterium]MBW2007596.1 hypothetical protein [Deltaproteobacteria bacterium]